MTFDVNLHNKLFFHLHNKLIYTFFQKTAAKNQVIAELHKKEKIVQLGVFEPPLNLNLNNIDSLKKMNSQELPLFNPLFGEQYKRTFR